MVQKLKGVNNQFLEAFNRLEQNGRAQDSTWLSGIRKAAIAKFLELGFPTTRSELWKYTNVSSVGETAFDFITDAEPNEVSREKIRPFLLGIPNGLVLVFVNGVYSSALSQIHPLPKGIHLSSLKEAIRSNPALVQESLARNSRYEDGFSALNTAFVRDGAFVHLEEGAVLGEPVHLLFAASAAHAHEALAPHQHPHATSMLPGVETIGVALLVLALAVIAFVYVKRG
jgi:Fe-S cluster assembly protein SufD